MLNFIDDFLNQITMYRLVLYYLIAVWLGGLAFSILGILAFSPSLMILILLMILIFCWAANVLFAYVFKAQTNNESLYITALILALIISPAPSGDYQHFFIFLGWASILSMASKYIFAISKKHIFNPAAFAVAVTALFLNQSASWWVGTPTMVSFVLIGGLLVVRKLRRSDLVFYFIFTAILTIATFSLLSGANPITSIYRAIFSSALLFFAFVMLTEPLTTPPTKNLQIYYGIITGFLFAPQVHIESFYLTPEIALLLGNIFSYLVSPKEKLVLTLKNKFEVAKNVFDFSFMPDKQMQFSPGQYLEWTLEHERSDARGNRRYFTISSSPTEKEINMGVKFYPEPSSFKKSLLSLQPGQTIVASQLAGDFVLPKDRNQKLVFMAGGIGVTPFLSMIKYLLDKKEIRPIVFLYANANEEDIAYKEIFDRASEELNIKVIYALTNAEQVSASWMGYKGRIDAQLIEKEIPDFKERNFYISGPHAMVTAYENTLKQMGLNSSQIITDFFPGFA